MAARSRKMAARVQYHEERLQGGVRDADRDESAPAKWSLDRKLAGVEHKYLGQFGARRSGARYMRINAGAKIPPASRRSTEIRYLHRGHDR